MRRITPRKWVVTITETIEHDFIVEAPIRPRHTDNLGEPIASRFVRRGFVTARLASQSVEDRFLEFVPTDLGPDVCWPWRGTRSKKHYPVFSVGKHQIRGNRYALERLGVDVPSDMSVLHSCDNPPCVNPAHLSVGTTGENQRQKGERGRAARGTKNAANKLSEDQVREIRQLVADGGSLKAIGHKYGITGTMVGHIKKRKAWAWLT